MPNKMPLSATCHGFFTNRVIHECLPVLSVAVFVQETVMIANFSRHKDQIHLSQNSFVFLPHLPGSTSIEILTTPYNQN